MLKKALSIFILIIIITSSTPIPLAITPANGEQSKDTASIEAANPQKREGVVWSEYEYLKPMHLYADQRHIYVTSFGNYTFTDGGASVSYTSRGAENQISRAYFWVNATSVGDFNERRNTRVTFANDTVFTGSMMSSD